MSLPDGPFGDHQRLWAEPKISKPITQDNGDRSLLRNTRRPLGHLEELRNRYYLSTHRMIHW